MELIPLVLALIFALKVEISHADRSSDMEFYRIKLAEHRHRCGSCVRLNKVEPVHNTHENAREQGSAIDGELR